jgi:hypothetical protein
MLRLRLVAARRQRREGAAADQPQAVLRVAHVSSGDELEETARRAVRDPPVRGHPREIVEAISDHELRVACGCEEGRDDVGRMLAVGVDHEHRVGPVRGRLGVVDAGPDGRAFAAAEGKANEIDPGVGRDRIERARDAGL